MKVPSFNEFISEAVENPKLVIITDEPEQAKTFHTADRLQQEAKKLGWKYYLYKLTGGYTSNEDNIRRLHNKDDEKGFVVDKNTIAIFRGSVVRRDSWMDIISMFEKDKVCCINSRDCIEICTDKYRTSIKLADFGLRQPKSSLITDKENALKAFENLDTDFPIILKTLRGSKGVGVLFIESKIGLDSIVQLINKQDEDADLLVQEYIKTDYDVRVLVLGGKVLATMKRPVIKGDFRSNVSQGSKPEELKLTELEIEECIKAAKAVNGVWTAVDFIPSKDRKKEPPFMIEVNSSPGTEGMEEATGRNISKEILEYFTNRRNWVQAPSQCGYKEVMTIKPFGDIVAKFDTGNSGTNVIHAENMEVKGKKVTWSLYNKTITSDIISKEGIKVGGLRDYEEDRYLIKLDVQFAGTLYTDVEFTLDDREDRTHILLDRQFMNRLNVMVDPSRKYIVTSPYSIDK